MINGIEVIKNRSVYNYQYEGEHIPTHKAASFNKKLWTIPSAMGQTSNQGMAYHNGYLFMLYDGGVCAVINMATGQKTVEYSISSAHGNSASFSKEYDNASDPFPLLYASDWNVNINHVYVNKVDLTGTTLIRTLKLPQNQAGYYACGAVDKNKNHLIVSGYSQPSATDPTNNQTIITVWDLNDLTLDGSEYIPALVDRFVIPEFYGAMQDREVYNGQLWILNGLFSSGFPTMIHVVDLEKKKVSTTFSNWPWRISTYEPEGLTTIPDTTQDKFLMTYYNKYVEMALN